ncbi:MAG: hypothetical protein NUV57_02380 [archaeon]|nr:hypothetical protein [archaeon]
MNQKGQAAVTDALYFLLIVTSLSIFLFGFANSYGESVRILIGDEYNSTFATNALKSILYSSTTRDPSQNISDPNAEIDYLLAIVKEDYADDQKINDNEKKVLGKAIRSIMSPVGDTFDYMFTIQTTGNDREFVYIFIHTTNFVRTDPPAFVIARDFYTYSAGDPSHVDYFCGADAEFSAVGNAITRLRANVGPTAESSSAIKMIKEQPGTSDIASFNAQIDLILWDAVWLGTTQDRTRGLLYSTDPSNPDDIELDWNCEPAELD